MNWANWIMQFEVIGEVALAMLLGGVIGFEREIADKPAGAGTIFRRSSGEQVQGLTTAASILLCAAVGISVALRQFVLAVGVTLLALIVLRGLTGIEKRLNRVKR